MNINIKDIDVTQSCLFNQGSPREIKESRKTIICACEKHPYDEDYVVQIVDKVFEMRKENPCIHDKILLSLGGHYGMKKLIDRAIHHNGIKINECINQAAGHGHLDTLKFIIQEFYHGQTPPQIILDHGYSWACQSQKKYPEIMTYLASLGAQTCHWPECPHVHF